MTFDGAFDNLDNVFVNDHRPDTTNVNTSEMETQTIRESTGPSVRESSPTHPIGGLYSSLAI